MFENVTLLTENQRRVLPFLAANPNISNACKEAGVTPKTVYAWLHESPAFREALRQRRMAIADAAMDGLRSRIEKAVDTLTALLDGSKESVRRSAARDILDLSLRLKEINEIEVRLVKLEQMMEVRNAK